MNIQIHATLTEDELRAALQEEKRGLSSAEDFKQPKEKETA